MHGDFHVGNLLFGNEGVVGVLDWEIAGLGDPRWDLGSLAAAAIRRRYRPEVPRCCRTTARIVFLSEKWEKECLGSIGSSVRNSRTTPCAW